MKHLKLIFACLLTAILSIGQVWAGEYTHTFATATQSISGDVCTVTVADGHPLSIIVEKNGASNFASYAPFRMYNKNKMTISASSGYVITQVDINFNSAQDLTVATDAAGYSYESYSFIPQDGSGDPSSCSTVSFTNGKSSQARITSVTIKYEASGSTPKCATPTFSPAAGSYEGTQNVTISSTSGATIYYTTDGSNPTTSGTKQTYSDPIAVSVDMTIKAYATLTSYDDSEVAEAAYEITEGPDVTIAFEGNTDWDIPSGNSNKTVEEGTYTDGTCTIKIAGSTGEGYYINGYLLLGKTGAYVELPEFSNPVEKIVVVGTSGGSTGVKFNIYDATTAVSTEVTGCKNVSQEFTITNPAANKAYKVQVTSNANLQISAIKIYFGEAPAVAQPTISGETPFLNTTNVTISIPEGSTVYYTTDGSTPSDASTQYSAPFTLNNSATVKAIAKIGSDVSAVAEKAFTKATVMTVAEARTAIDAGGDLTNKFVAGIISQIDSYNSTYNSITYWISDDGTTTDQLQVYSGKGLNGADFADKSDLSIGDEVIVTGTLKKFNSTYEFDMNSQIVQLTRDVAAPTFTPDGGGFLNTLSVSLACATDGAEIRYTIDGTDPTELSSLYSEALSLTATTTIKAIAFKGGSPSAIVSKTFTKGTKITVAAALTALDSNNPIENQFVYGIVSTAPTSNPSSGRLTYFVSDDGSTTNQLEVYNGYGLNGAAFTNKTDLQVGDEVTVYGTLTIHNETKEFAANSNLIEFNRPVVAVTGVDLASTATVKVGKTINLSASVIPANASNKTINWSIISGNENITFDNGAVTGVAEGTAVVRATSDADNTKYAECTITIAAADPTYLYYNYEKVTVTADIEDGEYLIVYEGDATHDAVAFNGSLETLDVAKNNINVEIEDNVIIGTNALHAATFTIGVTAGTLQSASGKFIGVTSNSNGLKTSDNADAYSHNFSIDENGNAVIAPAFSGSTMALRYNYGSNDLRFRYYGASSQRAIALYKKVGTNEAPKANPQLAWDPADDIVLTVGDAFTAPTLTYAEGFNGVASVGIESSNTALATVTAGVVELVTDATGEATITATFAGNEDYKSATVSYKITVNAAPSPAASGNVVILAEYDSKFYAMTNSLASGALAGVEVEKDGSKIVVSSAEDQAAIQWTATIEGNNTTLKDANNKYITGSSGASVSLEDVAYNWNWDGEKSCYISSSYTTRGLFFSNSGNVFKGYALTNLESNGYAAIEVIEIDPENIVITSKVDPQLAYTPASDEITAGDAWSAPALGYVDGFDGLATVTYASNNEAVATVSDAGVIALAGGTGTAVITASFPGNANYLLGSATYTIKVNEPAEDCDGSDDFSTATNTSASSYNVARTTTNGWSSVNTALTTINSEARWLTMLGKTSQVGVITSPTLSDGIASLKIRYANTFSESNGVSFKVEIKQGEDIVKTFSVTKANSEVTQGTVYTEEIKNINVAGDFQIIFTNLCPSAANSNKDRVSIGKLCWANYSEVTPPTPAYTDIRTGLTAGNYYTVCWPKAMTAIKGATLWSFAGKDASMAYLIQEDAPFVAGRPYIIYATADKLEAVVEGDDADAGSNNGLYGTLDYMDADALEAAGATYMLKNNELRPIGTNNHLDANRAYVILDEIQGGKPLNVPAHKVRGIPTQGTESQGVDNLNASETPVKMMIDGQLFIIRGEKMYDATGRLVK